MVHKSSGGGDEASNLANCGGSRWRRVAVFGVELNWVLFLLVYAKFPGRGFV